MKLILMTLLTSDMEPLTRKVEMINDHDYTGMNVDIIKRGILKTYNDTFKNHLNQDADQSILKEMEFINYARLIIYDSITNITIRDVDATILIQSIPDSYLWENENDAI